MRLIDSARERPLFSFAKETMLAMFEWVVSTGRCSRGMNANSLHSWLVPFSSFFLYYILPILTPSVESVLSDRRFSISQPFHSLKSFLLPCHSVYKYLSNLWIVNSIASWYSTIAIYSTIGHVRFFSFVLYTRRF